MGLRPIAWPLTFLLAAAAFGQEPSELLSAPLAEAFGSAPLISGARLSPDGYRVSFIQTRPDGSSAALVFDTRSGNITGAISFSADDYDINWCGWATDERLLCSVRVVAKLCGPELPSVPCRDNTYAALIGNSIPFMRLVAVNADGSEPVLLLRQVRIPNQDRIIDWLPDDPDHVLIALGSRVYRVDIHDGSAASITSGRYPDSDWITDGHGNPSLRSTVSETSRTWYVRQRTAASWSTLHHTRLTDLEDQYRAVAFDGDTNEVIFFDRHEGRMALFALDLDNDGARRLIYADPRFDVGRIYRLGRYNRVVGVEVIEDRPTPHFFDAAIEHVHDTLETEFPGMTISILDEDEAQRRYLVFIHSDRDAGTYYVFDAGSPELIRVSDARPELREHKLAIMQPVSYPSADGTEIPAYLTLPPDGASGAGVVLPHDDPSGRDYLQFDFLAQFLAARGYAVLQSNYRGSGGYGEAWSGQGGYRDWGRAADDISDGARYLVEQGIVDSGRLCVVGRGYGGYIGLLDVIENIGLYRCAVSIGGVSDPSLVARRESLFVAGERWQKYVGSGNDVLQLGSPLQRANEIRVPTLLIHSRDDFDVPLRHSAELRDSMNDGYTDVELVAYDHAGHDIRPPRYRIDMLTRIGAFLDNHLAASRPDFFSTAGPAPDAVATVDFGIDATEPNGTCSDARFTGAAGEILRDFGHPLRKMRDDATDCRQLFMSGQIVLRESFAPNHADKVPDSVRTTFFIDPDQQDGADIVSLNGRSDGMGPGVPIVYGRPGYGIIGVRARMLDYACTIIVTNSRNAPEASYLTQPGGGNGQTSFVVVPAYAGRYYRIHAEIVKDTLLLRVTDAVEDRVIVDQREIVRSGCD